MLSYHFHTLCVFPSILGLTLSLSEDANCYWPDGSPDTDGYPCNTSGDESACCAENDACFGKSGLCYSNGSGGIYRRSCTDSEFSDPSCATVCTGVREDAFVYLLQCNNIGNQSPGSGDWCCVGTEQTSCCGESSLAINEAFSPSIIDVPNFAVPYNSLSDYSGALLPTTATTTKIVTDFVDQDSGSTVQAVTLTATATVTSITDAADTKETSDPDLPLCAASDAKYEKVRNAAIGVGVSMGTLAAVASAAFLWAFFRRGREVRQSPPPQYAAAAAVSNEKEVSTSSPVWTQGSPASPQRAPMSHQRSPLGTELPGAGGVSGLGLR